MLTIGAEGFRIVKKQNVLFHGGRQGARRIEPPRRWIARRSFRGQHGVAVAHAAHANFYHGKFQVRAKKRRVGQLGTLFTENRKGDSVALQVSIGRAG